MNDEPELLKLLRNSSYQLLHTLLILPAQKPLDTS